MKLKRRVYISSLSFLLVLAIAALPNSAKAQGQPVTSTITSAQQTGAGPTTPTPIIQSDTDQLLDALTIISTLVTLYYSAALLIGLAVAFLGWRTIRDLRSRAREVAEEVLAEREKELVQATGRLQDLVQAASRIRPELLQQVEEAREFLAAKASTEQMETEPPDVHQIFMRARNLPEKERVEMLSLILKHKLAGPAGAFHNAGTSAGFVGHYRLGLQIYELGLESHPEDMTLLTDAADNAAMLGDYEKAEALFEKAIEVAPGHPRVWEFYADYWYKYRDDSNRAIQVLEPKLADLQPTAGLMREAGTIYQDLGDLEKAEELYRKGLEVEKDDHLLLNRLGLLLRTKGNTQEAARFLRSATIYSQGHGNQRQYFIELGTTLFELKEYESALKAFLSAEALAPGSATFWIKRCEIEMVGVALLARSPQ